MWRGRKNVEYVPIALTPDRYVPIPNWLLPASVAVTNVGEMMRTRANMAALSVSSALVLSQSTGVIMVSYETLIQPLSNRDLVTRLCTLIGGSPDNIDAAMLTISPEDAAYRQRARGGQPAKLPATAANASSSD